jgi:hypothetical protein
MPLLKCSHLRRDLPGLSFLFSFTLPDNLPENSLQTVNPHWISVQILNDGNPSYVLKNSGLSPEELTTFPSAPAPTKCQPGYLQLPSIACLSDSLLLKFTRLPAPSAPSRSPIPYSYNRCDKLQVNGYSTARGLLCAESPSLFRAGALNL